MKNFLLTLTLIQTSLTLPAQNQTDPIEIEKVFLGTTFSQNGYPLSSKQVLEITKVNPVAYKKMKAARVNYHVSNVLGFIGGGLIGYPLGTAIAGGEPEWILAGIGAGVIGVAIPFATAYTKRAKKAVELYNNELISSRNSPGVHLHLGLCSSGIRFKLTF